MGMKKLFNFAVRNDTRFIDLSVIIQEHEQAIKTLQHMKRKGVVAYN